MDYRVVRGIFWECDNCEVKGLRSYPEGWVVISPRIRRNKSGKGSKVVMETVLCSKCAENLEIPTPRKLARLFLGAQ